MAGKLAALKNGEVVEIDVTSDESVLEAVDNGTGGNSFISTVGGLLPA